MLAKKVLFLLTDDFPVGGKEPYLVEELPQLRKVFSDIIFVTTLPGLQHIAGTGNHLHITFPNGPLEKVKAIGGIFHWSVWKEIVSLLKEKRISIYKIKLILSYFHRAKIISQILLKHSSERFPNAKITYYSYWCDERALAAGLIKQRQNAISLSRAHGWDVYAERSPENYLPFRPWLLRNLDLMVCISENGKEYLEKKYGPLAIKKTEIHRLGSSTLKEIPKKQEGHIFTLLSIAYAVPLKRLSKIIEALSHSQFEQIRWIHLGGGPELNRLIQMQNDLNGSKENLGVEFRGSVSHDLIIDFLENNFVDLFINVSETEGLPVSIMEAMSAQIPCLATNVGGSGEIVNSLNGYLVPVGISNKNLWDTIQIHYHLDLDTSSQMRNNAYQTWKEKYSSEKNYFSFAERLKNLNSHLV